ncbi:FAD-binding oxidoreductase, partial [candidate division GN15 bacterium]|nr:FAD-binding oxidoreductase [candidate division GN15 bacterium]
SCLRVESDPATAEDLWRVRRNLSHAAKAVAKLRISEDVAVPNDQFPNLVAFVAELNAGSSLRINSYGHAGDGNLHVNFMAAEDTPEAHDEIDRQVRELMQKTVELGGTVTGEHGIGLAKRQFLPLEFDPPTLEAMRGVKQIMDPDHLFNPDKLFLVR